jgi:hypothetical protein
MMVVSQFSGLGTYFNMNNKVHGGSNGEREEQLLGAWVQSTLAAGPLDTRPHPRRLQVAARFRNCQAQLSSVILLQQPSVLVANIQTTFVFSKTKMSSPEYIALDRLEGYHYHTLSSALHNVLHTDIALMTYAQIIDGLPTADVVWDRYSGSYEPSHPINNHKTLCKGALDKAKGFRAQFSMADVMVDLMVCSPAANSQ